MVKLAIMREGFSPGAASINYIEAKKIYINGNVSMFESVNMYSGVISAETGVGLTTSNYNVAIKKNGTSNSAWWLRSAYSNLNYTFIIKGASGRWYHNNATNINGVSPAFKIG